MANVSSTRLSISGHPMWMVMRLSDVRWRIPWRSRWFCDWARPLDVCPSLVPGLLLAWLRLRLRWAPLLSGRFPSLSPVFSWQARQLPIAVTRRRHRLEPSVATKVRPWTPAKYASQTQINMPAPQPGAMLALRQLIHRAPLSQEMFHKSDANKVFSRYLINVQFLTPVPPNAKDERINMIQGFSKVMAQMGINDLHRRPAMNQMCHLKNNI